MSDNLQDQLLENRFASEIKRLKKMVNQLSNFRRLFLPRFATDPLDIQDGEIWNDTVTNTIKTQLNGLQFVIAAPDFYEDLYVPINSLKIPSVNNPTWVSYKGGEVLEFSDQAVIGNEEYGSFSLKIPHARRIDTDIIPHIHWIGEDANAGNVRWRLTYSWANEGDVFPTETEVFAIGANSTTLDTHNVTQFSALSGSGKDPESMLICSISRNSSDALDTYAGGARAFEIDFHIRKDRAGEISAP